MKIEALQNGLKPGDICYYYKYHLISIVRLIDINHQEFAGNVKFQVLWGEAKGFNDADLGVYFYKKEELQPFLLSCIENYSTALEKIDTFKGEANEISS